MSSPPSIAALIEESYALEGAGDLGAALQRARQALEDAHAGGDVSLGVAARVCLAHIHYHLGHYDQAMVQAETALAHAAPDAPEQPEALRILGNCAHEMGDLGLAEALYHQAIDLARQLGNRRALQTCLHSLSACVYIPRGQFELALAADEESLRLALEGDMPEVAWFPLVTMGWVYWATGRRGRALALIEEMRPYVQPGSLAEGYYFCLAADLAQEGDDPGSAPSLYARARSIAEAVGDPGLNAELRVGLSRYHRRAGQAPAAHDWADDALKIASDAGSRDLQTWALIERGRALWEMGDLAAAKADLRAAVEFLAPLRADFDLARTHLLLAALLHRAPGESQEEAEAAWCEAVSYIVRGGYAFLLEQERALAFPLLAESMSSPDSAVAAASASLLEHLARVPPPPLHVRTLGRFRVRQGQRPIPARAWRRRRAGELFRLLLVSPRHSLSHEQVVEALWPGDPLAARHTALHQATSALRQALEPDLPNRFPSRYVQVEGGRVMLCLPPGTWLDWLEFERQVQDGEWEAALAHYEGKLFPDDRYADWAAAPREHLTYLHLQALQELARACLASGRPREALDACRQILGFEPWHESAVLLGMQACLALEDRVTAMRLYRDLDRALQQELGVAPQQALQDLYQQVSVL